MMVSGRRDLTRVRRALFWVTHRIFDWSTAYGLVLMLGFRLNFPISGAIVDTCFLPKLNVYLDIPGDDPNVLGLHMFVLLQTIISIYIYVISGYIP